MKKNQVAEKSTGTDIYFHNLAEAVVCAYSSACRNSMMYIQVLLRGKGERRLVGG